MKAIFIVSTLILMLQGCVVMTPQEAQNSRSSWANNSNSSSANPWTRNTKSANTGYENSNRRGEDYLYYYVAHSFSRANLNNEGTAQYGNASDLQTESSGYGHKYAFNGEKSLILTDVVSKMAEQLLYNYDAQFHNESIALTSLVDLNDHKTTSWLGQTISEQFIHELHIRNLRVVDYKLMGSIQVTDKGEFGMSRDWTKLNKNVDVTRILAGTMSRNEEGLILNVRIVNANNNVVESTSSAFIPHALFVGGIYDYNQKKYVSRTTSVKNKSLVRLVK